MDKGTTAEANMLPRRAVTGQHNDAGQASKRNDCIVRVL
jgi:hypothetical protein